MRSDAFAGFHPAVNLAFFAAVIGMTMFLMQPVYLLISLLCGSLYLLYLQGWRGMRRQVGYLLPVLLTMAAVNALFNHEGVTVLAYLPNDNPVTLEAVVYGFFAAVMLGASIVWFNCLGAIFTTDKIICLFGRVIPALSLLISMTLRFVPRFKHFLQSTLRVQQAMHRPEGKLGRLKQALDAFSATVSWAMEQSIVSADSMKSRGYGLPGRTAFTIYRFTRRDGSFLLLLAVLTPAAVLPSLLGLTRWTFYPAMTGTLAGPWQFLAYFAYGAACLLPLAIDLLEDQKWNSLRSGI